MSHFLTLNESIYVRSYVQIGYDKLAEVNTPTYKPNLLTFCHFHGFLLKLSLYKRGIFRLIRVEKFL